MTQIARVNGGDPSPLAERTLPQLASELLLAQSSDWAFLIKTGTAKHYAAKRATDHIARFNKLYGRLKAKAIDAELLGDCETRDNLFPDLQWHYYL